MQENTMPDYRDSSSGLGIVGVIVGILVAFAIGYMLLGPSNTTTTTARVEPRTTNPPVTAPVTPTPAPATPATPPATKP